MPAYAVRCLNESCPHFRQDRRVAYREVGDGLYERPQNVVCECGTAPRPLGPVMDAPAHRRAEKAVKRAPERRKAS